MAIQTNLLPEVTSVGIDDTYIVDTPAGTRKVKRRNTHLRKGELSVLLASGVNITNDFVLIFDGTDGVLKEISVSELVFGNFLNVSEEDDFTLEPGIHNVRPVQCSGNFATATITLDGNLAIEGCAFVIANFASENLTVTPVNGVALRANGVTGPGVIRIDRSATIIVSNGGGNAIFSGG